MKKNIVIVLLSVVALLLAGTVGYFIADKGATSNENNIEESLDIEFAESIIGEYYKSSNHRGGNIFTKGLSDEMKMLIALNNVPLKNISGVDCSAFYDESYKSEDGSYYYVPLNNSDKNGGACDISSNSIYYSDVNSVYNDLFGSDMPKRDLNMGIYTFDYIEDSDVYISLSFYGGAADFSMDFYKVKDIQLNDKELIINVAYSSFTPILSDSFVVPTTYTPDFDSTLEIEVEPNVDFEVLKKDIFEKYLDKMATYKFTFEKENIKYMLKDVSKVEA